MKINIDKLIGSITIAIGFLVILYVAYAMWENEKNSHNTVYVLFSEIGALQKEDAVTLRGYQIGHVASITMANDSIIMHNDSLRQVSDTSAVARKRKRDAMALVKIDLYEPFTFSKDTRFKNVSPSILGSRSISIELGKSDQRIPKDYIFLGEFEPGFAEVLYLADMAKEQVANLMAVIRLLYTGDSAKPSLQTNIENILVETEEFIDMFSGILGSVENQTFNALDKIGGYVETVSNASVKIKHSLDTIRVQAQDGIVFLDKLVLDVEAAIENLENFLTQFENSPVAKALLEEKTIINDLENLLATLQGFIGSIDRHGIVIYDENGKRKNMVQFWRNMHIIREPARSKARKRAEQEAAANKP